MTAGPLNAPARLEDRALSIGSLILAILFTLIGLATSIRVRRRIRKNGGDSHLATLGVQVGVFLVAVAAVVVAVRFTLSVVVPLLTR